MDIEVKSHMSALDEEVIATIRSAYFWRPRKEETVEETRIKPTVIRRRRKTVQVEPWSSPPEDEPAGRPRWQPPATEEMKPQPEEALTKNQLPKKRSKKRLKCQLPKSRKKRRSRFSKNRSKPSETPQKGTFGQNHQAAGQTAGKAI